MGAKEVVRIANDLYKKGDYESAFREYYKLAKNGDSDCQRMVGEMLLFGKGVTLDIEQAKFWLKEPAKENNVEAIYHLGTIHHIERSYQEAIKYYEKSAEMDFAPAYLRLGRMNEIGRGGPVNLKKALEFYWEAVKLGNIPARRQVAILQIKGINGFLGRIMGFSNFSLFIMLLVKESIKDHNSFRLNR